jgi:hypothetical protein
LPAASSPALGIGGMACSPVIFGIGAAPLHHVHRSPSTRLLTDARGGAVDDPQVEAPGCPAAGTMNIGPRHPGDNRGADRRRPPQVPAGGNGLVPPLDHTRGIVTLGAIGGLAAHGGDHVEGAGADAHRAIMACNAGEARVPAALRSGAAGGAGEGEVESMAVVVIQAGLARTSGEEGVRVFC